MADGDKAFCHRIAQKMYEVFASHFSISDNMPSWFELDRDNRDAWIRVAELELPAHQMAREVAELYCVECGADAALYCESCAGQD